MKLKVYNWRYSDGWTVVPYLLRKNKGEEELEFQPGSVGWFCHVYTDQHREFEDWMKANMKEDYDASLRYNSGNPMHTVRITGAEDATIFKLSWLT